MSARLRPSGSSGPHAPRVSRRSVMKGAAALLGSSVAPGLLPRAASASAEVAATPAEGVEWYVTTAASAWQRRDAPLAPAGGMGDVIGPGRRAAAGDRGLRRVLQRARLDVARGALCGRPGFRAARAVRARRRRRLHAVPDAGRRQRLLARLVLVRRDGRRLRARALQHRERPRDAGAVHPGGAAAAAGAAAVGLAVEPALLDEEEPALRDGAAGALAEGRRERPAARPGRPRGHRHVRPWRTATSAPTPPTSGASSTSTASRASRSAW